jgi:hypothetical protein
VFKSTEIHKQVLENLQALDIYSFAYIMYETMAGREPFHHLANVYYLNSEQLERDIVRKRLRPCIDEDIHWPKGFIELMKDCWEREPYDRPKNFSVITVRLAEIIKNNS